VKKVKKSEAKKNKVVPEKRFREDDIKNGFKKILNSR